MTESANDIQDIQRSRSLSVSSLISATEMDSLTTNAQNMPRDTKQAQASNRYFDALPGGEASGSRDHGTEITRISTNEFRETAPIEYRVYKRRFFGLIQLTLLNIIVSWDWLTFAPVSTSSAQYFRVTEGSINWLSTGFLFAFVVATPASIWALNKGPKLAILCASALILVGNWVRYAGARSREDQGGVFGLVVFGQVLIGLAQPFVLAAPTRYSELWFSEKGRITATALASLANPFGGAVGQLVDPFWATDASNIPNLVLWVSIISTIVAIPSIFLPAKPPTPPTPSSSLAKPVITIKVLRSLFTNPSFYLLALPFIIYVSCFNATSTLLNQILSPYGFSETDAGITGALLIVVGLVSAAITSPLLDRHHSARLPFIRILVPILAAMYLAFIWAPQTRTVAAPYAISSVLGAASFSLVPLALELLVDFTYPISAEISSAIAWSGGQLGGALLILSMDALKDPLKPGQDKGQPKNGETPGNGFGENGPMTRALVLQAVIAIAVVPAPLVLGFWGTGRGRRAEQGMPRAAVQDLSPEIEGGS